MSHWFGGWCVHGPYHSQKIVGRSRRMFVSGLSRSVITPFRADTPVPDPLYTTLGFYDWNDLVEEWHWFEG